MHCLLHADDTALVSTNQQLFMKKCNTMLKYLEINKLSLNLSKSSYMIINGNNATPKTNIKLDNGMLSYKPTVVYLGAIISDSGSIRLDINKHLDAKRANITVKFNNFCRRNHLSPINIKLKVLNTCATAALSYGCETWGNHITPRLETLYRTGIKYAMSIRPTINNELVYTESGCLPLFIRIKKQQLKFWKTIQQTVRENDNGPLSKLIYQGETLNLPYLKYYHTLEETYINPKNCSITLQREFLDQNNLTILRGANDPLSKFGTYLQVNPNLYKPQSNELFELDRIRISRYRIGSHKLRIETGRMRNPIIPREDRLCLCGDDIQSLIHVLTNCRLLKDLYEKYKLPPSVDKAFDNPSISNFLLEMERILSII